MKKLLTVLLVVVMAMSVMTIAAFGLAACPEDAGHTLNHNTAVDATCTTDGNKEYWHCAECDKDYNDAGEVLTTVTVPAAHNKQHVDAAAPDCATGTQGYQAYEECSVCHKLFKEDGTLITSPVPVAANHTDDNSDGYCDVCLKPIECVITFQYERDGVIYPVGSMKVKQGSKMGYPVSAPEPPKGYAYERLNNSVWKLVEGGHISDSSQTYNANNVVTVGTTELTYRAVMKPQVMNLTVAFRVNGTEYIYCTINNVPYGDTVDANGKGISVYEYILTHDKNGAVDASNSINKTFTAAFNNKNIPVLSGGSIDVTGYKWEVDQKFLSSYSNNPINNGDLTMNINYGALSSDIKIYAKLTAQTSFKVSFAPMSPYGTNAAVQGTFDQRTVSYGSVLSNLPTPTCNGYIFMGWYDEPMKGNMTYADHSVTLDTANGSAKHYTNGTQFNSRGDVTLYPYWIPEVDAWVVVHNNKNEIISSMAKIQGVKPTDSITKTDVLANVQGYTAGNFVGPILSNSATGFTAWTSAAMGASVQTQAGQSYYFHVYAPGASAKTVTPSGNSGANGGYANVVTGSNVDPSNPKTGDLARNNLNVACAALAVSVIAMGAVVCTFPKKKEI